MIFYLPMDEYSGSEEDEYVKGDICVMRRKKRMSTRRNRSPDKAKSSKPSIQELIIEDEDSVPKETVDNTDQTPPVAEAEVNMMTAADIGPVKDHLSPDYKRFCCRATKLQVEYQLNTSE